MELTYWISFLTNPSGPRYERSSVACHGLRNSFFLPPHKPSFATPPRAHTCSTDPMATSRMFLPLMFSDRTGSIFGSEFTDLYDRMSLGVRRTRHDSDGATQYGIYNTMSPYSTPVATLDYGAGGTLGTVTFNGAGGSVRTHAMSSFLTEVGGPRHRKFTASDQKEYIWGWRTNTQDSLEEWTCVNSNGDTVAWYALGVPGEVYESSSGRAFGVEELYLHLTVEFLATLLIMRYIATLDT